MSCTSEKPCLSPMLRWVHSPRCQQETRYAHSFGWAIEQLKKSRRVTRAGWNGKGMYLELQTPDAHSKMTLPYIFMKTAQGDLVPWLASQTDMLGEDWGHITT